MLFKPVTCAAPSSTGAPVDAVEVYDFEPADSLDGAECDATLDLTRGVCTPMTTAPWGRFFLFVQPPPPHSPDPIDAVHRSRDSYGRPLCLTPARVGIHVFPSRDAVDARRPLVVECTVTLSCSSGSAESTLSACSSAEDVDDVSVAFATRFETDAVGCVKRPAMRVAFKWRTPPDTAEPAATTSLSPVTAAVDPPATSIRDLDALFTLNDRAVSNCALVPADSDLTLWVSRPILARASPFFDAMFRGPWADARSPTLSASPVAVLLCVVHAYCGWVPGTDQFPHASWMDEFCGGEDVDNLDDAAWREVLDLARMLELRVLAVAVARLLVARLEDEMRDLSSASVVCVEGQAVLV
ncbi:hypothetical protein AMAG_16065 [Allomyces macrogynus ATCC 38327]|uniref:BTB domain-containing protein n=1 Tax=Allomyces macrogynus (strain ATCC 38327) TaxID=578462 RepID=A0A0L0TAL6_ALLM3|nr:hypothetical protein AMAG_16065 [Allomyces macrogynus ATCC 38327]|eukprot:KNE71761.1 hypothetical protein AMAG_16065 [Allomyces macrogynus ATCC 38327]